jgi:hypothetical protein
MPWSKQVAEKSQDNSYIQIKLLIIEFIIISSNVACFYGRGNSTQILVIHGEIGRKGIVFLHASVLHASVQKH